MDGSQPNGVGSAFKALDFLCLGLIVSHGRGINGCGKALPGILKLSFRRSFGVASQRFFFHTPDRTDSLASPIVTKRVLHSIAHSLEGPKMISARGVECPSVALAVQCDFSTGSLFRVSFMVASCLTDTGSVKK